MLLRTLVLLALMTATAAAQNPFEGSIAMSVTSQDGATMPVNYMVKDGKIRFDMSQSGQMGGIVIDPAGQKMLIVIDEQRMYMEMALPPAGASGRQGRGTGRSGAAAERTGRMEMIAGIQCEHVLTTDDDGTRVDSCVTNDLGPFRMFTAGNPMQPPREAGWAAGLGPGSFPLKVQKGEKVILEVSKVERKGLEAALFAAPAGYRKFSMPGRGGPRD